MDETKFKEEIATKSRQFSYNIAGLGRCHIRQTGQYITGLKLDDNIEFSFAAPAEETDYIIKTGVMVMQYVKGECFSIAVPNVMSADSEEDENVLSAIMGLGYGMSVKCRDVHASAEKIEELRVKTGMELIVPFHRVEYSGEPEHSKRLRAIEQTNMPKFQAALEEYLNKQPMDIFGAI
jgi:hypothetical protein